MQDHYDVPADFSFIFCRNVLIYFDKPTQEAVIGSCAGTCSAAATCSWATPNPSPTWTCRSNRSAPRFSENKGW
jgi:hypothetical protein